MLTLALGKVLDNVCDDVANEFDRVIPSLFSGSLNPDQRFMLSILGVERDASSKVILRCPEFCVIGFALVIVQELTQRGKILIGYGWHDRNEIQG